MATPRSWSLLVRMAASLLVVYFTVYYSMLYYPPGIPTIKSMNGLAMAELSQNNKGIETLDKNGIPVSLQVGSVSGRQKTLNKSDSSSWTNKCTKLERLRLFPCNDYSPSSFVGERGPYWVLYNFVTPTIQFACDESVTYAAHADHTYLSNLVPLLERWRGPVSLSLYAPGTDYDETLLWIQYLRACSSLVKDFVSFHLFFNREHIPENLTRTAEEDPAKINCAMGPPFGKSMTTTFRKTKNLSYPLNMARNIAREMAPTHYVIVSDIELYPSRNLIPDFLEMIRRDGSQIQQSPNPKVFVLPIFEVEANVAAIPYDKTGLQQMLNSSVAIIFHKQTCPKCHTIPKHKEWVRAKETKGLHVFHVGKRQGRYHHWELIYIGTKFDPMYDERLMWEGSHDKLPQGYILCVLDYEFHILDNAFLVHRPGIKGTVKVKNIENMKRQWRMIETTVLPELKRLYGCRPGCSF